MDKHKGRPRKRPPSIAVQTRLDPELYAQLYRYADAQGLAIAAAVRHLLKQRLDPA